MAIKKILCIGLLGFIMNQNMLADNNFQDMDYLIQKEMIKDTTLKLDILKKQYLTNSEEYNALNKAQQILLDNLPVDSFSTFSRIKLHNVVDSSIEERKRASMKNNVLKAEGDLNSAFLMKQQNIKEQLEREQKRKEEELSNEDIQNMIKTKSSGTPYSNKSTKKRKE